VELRDPLRLGTPIPPSNSRSSYTKKEFLVQNEI
jgi:hypothetical protein